MRGAIVGFGTIAMGHLAGYSQIPGMSIAAVADVSPDRRRYAEHSLGIPAYADLTELAAHENLDFIDICAPPDTHSEYTRLGLAYGLHVLCEKPIFTPEADGYERMMNAIWSSDRIFYPCHVYKFAPILGLMKEVISAPGFGEVRGANFRTLRRGHAVGVPEWRPHWRREPRISGGGILRDHGPHSIYLAMNLTGHIPLSVSCLMGGFRRDQYQDTEDTALLRMRCDDDVEIALTLSWASGYRSTSYSVMGSSGSIIAEDDQLLCTINGESIRSVIKSGFDDPSHKEWFRHMLLDFADTVANPGRQAELVREALVTSFAIDGAYVSAAQGGRWVEVRVPGGLLASRGDYR